MRFCRFFACLAVGYIIVTLIGSTWLVHKSYKFSTLSIDKFVRGSADGSDQTEVGGAWTMFRTRSSQDRDDSVSPSAVREKLEKEHDGLINQADLPPLAVITGGLHGSISLLYASLSEFLAIYHAPLQTSGNTGRHFMNISVTVMSGEVKVWYERQDDVIIYATGSNYSHKIGQKAYVEMQNGTYLLLYGRGLVPMTMGYWIADTLLSSCDLASAVLILLCYFKAVYMSLGLKEFFLYLWTLSWGTATTGLAQLPRLWTSLLSMLADATERLHGFFLNLF